MDVHQEHDEPQRREGFGSRVRRFIDSELGRALDKDDSPPDAPATAAAEPASTVTPATTAAAEPTTTVTPATTAAVEPTTTVTHTPAAEPTTTVTPAATAAEPTTTAGPATPVTAEETTPPRADGRRTDGRRTDQAAADGNAERVGLLNDPAGLRDQWQQVQGTFVDDPQRAVHEASVLVDRTLREIHENVSRGQISDPTSTEDLRVSFQRYREFFQRLLSA